MYPMPIIECIPNISEGRRPEVVEAIATAIRAVAGARLLDYSSDASHNRSVFTMAGDGPSLKAAVALYRSMGFVEVGVVKDQFRVDGVKIDDVAMTLAL